MFINTNTDPLLLPMIVKSLKFWLISFNPLNSVKDDGSGDRQNLHLRSSIFWPKGRLICIFKLVLEYRSGLCSTQVDLATSNRSTTNL